MNGSYSTKDIARNVRRPFESVVNDLLKLVDMELIREAKDTDGKVLKKDGATVFEKNPLTKHIPVSYFGAVADTRKLVVETSKTKKKNRETIRLHAPSENQILEICKSGEDQIYEFKAPGVETDKLTKEVAGFLHTRSGGVIFYGIDDDGTLVGTDIRRQDFDQRAHNSIRNTISPQPTVEVQERSVLGTMVLMILVPPWDRKTIYQDTKDGRYYIRRGTNIFALKPEELRKLTRGEYVV